MRAIYIYIYICYNIPPGHGLSYFVQSAITRADSHAKTTNVNTCQRENPNEIFHSFGLFASFLKFKYNVSLRVLQRTFGRPIFFQYPSSGNAYKFPSAAICGKISVSIDVGRSYHMHRKLISTWIKWIWQKYDFNVWFGVTREGHHAEFSAMDFAFLFRWTCKYLIHSCL